MIVGVSDVFWTMNAHTMIQQGLSIWARRTKLLRTRHASIGSYRNDPTRHHSLLMVISVVLSTIVVIHDQVKVGLGALGSLAQSRSGIIVF
jgi:hypothetical protein